MRWIVGLLLVGAALLKSVELLIGSAVPLSSTLGQYLLPLEIGIELATGLLILAGFYWHTLRWLAVVLFVAFGGYSLYLALKGAASCGCFGPLHVSPWWTFGLDSVVVLGLLVSVLIERRCAEISRNRANRRSKALSQVANVHSQLL